MKPLASTPSKMARSGIREVMDLASRVPGAIRLEAGEPNFPTPPHICEAAYRAAADGFTRYTPNGGLPSLREAICDKLHRVNAVNKDPDEIIVTHGALSGLMTSCMALLDPGDQILLPDPGWPNWVMMVLCAGAVPVRYPVWSHNGFVPEAGDVEALISPRTKALLLNSPANPTGAVYGERSQRELLDLAARYDLWVLSDEVYDELAFDGSYVSAAALDPDGRVISVFSLSKTYSMTGWRVGYIAAPPLASPLLRKLQEPTIGCVSGVTQKAAEAALIGPQAEVARMREAYRQRRDTALRVLDRVGLAASMPLGAFYLMVDVSRVTDDTYSFAQELLAHAQVAVAPGEAFGPSGRGLVRVSLATESAQLVEGLQRLVDYVENEGSGPQERRSATT